MEGLTIIFMKIVIHQIMLISLSEFVTGATSDGCEDGTVRLVDGCGQTQGRVELCVSNQWGTVCDDEWDRKDANVVCGQLGFLKRGAKALQRAQFGEGSGNIYLDNVQCTGNELNLTECPHNGLRVHDCNHDKDAGVTCKLPLTCLDQTETAVPTTVTVTETQSLTCSKTVQTVNKQCTVSPTGITTPMSTSSSEINNKCLTTNTTGLNEMINSTSTGVLGAFVGILLLIVVGLIIWWTLTSIYTIQKRKHNKYHFTDSSCREEDRSLQNSVYNEPAGVVLTHESFHNPLVERGYELMSPTSNILPLTTQNCEDHTYDIIQYRNLNTKKAPATNVERPSADQQVTNHNDSDLLPVVPERVIHNDDRQRSNDENTSCLNVLPGRNQNTEDGCCELEEPQRKPDNKNRLEDRSNWLLQTTNSNPENVYQVLEVDTDIPAHTQLSPADSSVEWEERSAATYEVPKYLQEFGLTNRQKPSADT